MPVVPRDKYTEPVRYYLYVSDVKVDMLYSLIPQPLRKRIAAELSIDLKLVSLALRDNPPEETRYSKARLVSEYIERELAVGTIENPETYVSGRIYARWTVFEEPGEPSIVGFFGHASSGPADAPPDLALIGSAKHLVGLTGEEQTVVGFGKHGEVLNAWNISTAVAASQPFNSGVANGEEEVEVDVKAVGENNEEGWATGPLQELEFLARTVAKDWNHDAKKYILLATPVYVSLAEFRPQTPSM